MGLRMKNFNIFGVHWKIWFLGGGLTKNLYRMGDCLKRGAWTVCRFKRGAWQERQGGVFEEGWYSNAHYAFEYGLTFPGFFSFTFTCTWHFSWKLWLLF